MKGAYLSFCFSLFILLHMWKSPETSNPLRKIYLIMLLKNKSILILVGYTLGTNPYLVNKISLSLITEGKNIFYFQ